VNGKNIKPPIEKRHGIGIEGIALHVSKPTEAYITETSEIEPQIVV